MDVFCCSESFRCAVPGSATFYFTPEEVWLDKFVIPAKSTLFISYYHIMHDPNTFENPDKFCPERFIDMEGKFVPNDRVKSYSIGKRGCPAQALVEKEHFLFVTSILQKFELEKIPGTHLPSYGMESSGGFQRVTPNFQCILRPRNDINI